MLNTKSISAGSSGKSSLKKDPDWMLFMKRFLASPTRVGSIIPSSPFLAQKMIRKEDVDLCKNIVELGAGTGIFTKYLLDCKSNKCDLYVFEKDPQFAECLQTKFPYIKLYEDAANLETMAQNGEIGQPDLVVSGIPFAVLEMSLRNKILEGVHEVLPEGGKFVTFQYSLDLLSDLKRLYKSVELEFVLLNIPPAVIYRCTK